MVRFQIKGLNEKGAALITVLLILALFTIIGISATNISTVEQQIATNDKQHKIVLYHTDAGLSAFAKLVNKAYRERALPPINETDLVLLGDAEDIYDQLKGFVDYDLGVSDLQYEMDGTLVAMDINRWGTGMGEGGGQSMEFITGAKDAATGGGGGATQYFRIRAVGQSSQKTKSTLSVNYIKSGDNNAGGI